MAPVGLTFFFSSLSFFLVVSSALLHAGHQVSRSHAAAGSLKTTATRRDLHDVYRSWVKTHPVKVDKIPPNSPARVLLEKEPRYDEPGEPPSFDEVDNVPTHATLAALKPTSLRIP